MIILLSPAKTLDFACEIPKHVVPSKPVFAEEAWQLAQILKTYSSMELAKLMHISANLSELNFNRFQNFSLSYNNSNSKPAICAYNGDVYEGINLSVYNESQLDFANENIRILSGLYGILRAFDLIQAYRLEMSIPLANPCGKNLYSFWQDKITNTLNQQAKDYIINLASKEYYSAVNIKKLSKKFINIQFKEKIAGDYKIIGIHAKKARGLMANFIISNLVDNPEKIKDFSINNYRYMPDLSSEEEYVFVR